MQPDDNGRLLIAKDLLDSVNREGKKTLNVYLLSINPENNTIMFELSPEMEENKKFVGKVKIDDKRRIVVSKILTTLSKYYGDDLNAYSYLFYVQKRSLRLVGHKLRW